MPLIADSANCANGRPASAARCLRDHAGRVQAREKSPADLVTEADVASQRAIKDVILGAFPDHGFLAEENESIPAGADRLAVDRRSAGRHHEFRAWHPGICRLDRTGASGELLVGVVYDPAPTSAIWPRPARGRFSMGADPGKPDHAAIESRCSD